VSSSHPWTALRNLKSGRADGVAYSCRGRGALLSLPHGGRREDAVQMKIFEKYIQDNVVSWFTWAQKNQLGVERMEDLILVSGCTLVTTWAAAVFMDHTMSAEVSLASRTLRNGGASFFWSNVRGPVVHHNSRFDPVRSPGYCLIRRALTFSCCVESKVHPRLISASLSRASEQNASSSGSNHSELQQNPVLMTLTTAETVTYL
jgi:hypothetical protein